MVSVSINSAKEEAENTQGEENDKCRMKKSQDWKRGGRLVFKLKDSGGHEGEGESTVKVGHKGGKKPG